MDDLARLKSIRQGGKTRGKAQIRRLEEGGKTRGYEVEYHDGRTEAVVRPETIRRRLSISGRDE